MKLFNAQRRNLMKGKGIRKYVLYAIGEIILVVIGILIAVSINNANEVRKTKNHLKNVLVTYQEDLKLDTLKVNNALELLNTRKLRFDQFLSDTVDIEMYKTYPRAMGLTLNYNPFELQQKGIRLLEKFESSTTETDSLVIQILAHHNAFDTLLKETHERIGDDVTDNMDYLKYNHAWIGDLLFGKLDNPEMYDYFLSDTYHARLAIHYMLVYGNLKPLLEQHLTSSKDILSKIESRING
ncbi:DUF6090 family protein [Aquimarina litoralis]|uniref:DUF6090 family protein n=1 Tax=Aquimarina litoralis TaxID=584605 RepID=UPI001C568A10|nr:DUF6090 family protein [Aquimarina litoralis]MBW1297423.1 hypothetical protein [Aquimarina litoralis]